MENFKTTYFFKTETDRGNKICNKSLTLIPVYEIVYKQNSRGKLTFKFEFYKN